MNEQAETTEEMHELLERMEERTPEEISLRKSLMPKTVAPESDTRSMAESTNALISRHREALDHPATTPLEAKALKINMRSLQNLAKRQEPDTQGEVTADAIRSKSLPAQTKPFCLACTAVGMSHCAYPDECGQVVHPISNERLEEIATEEWCEIEECNAMAKELMLFRKNRQKAGKR